MHLVVTPLGLGDAGRLLDDLHELGVDVMERTTLRAWSRLSTVLQVTKRSGPAIERAVVFENVWRQVAPEDCAEAWSLSLDHARAFLPHKRRVRERYRNLRVELPTRRPITLHAFHLADEDDLVPAARRLITATV
ncbi:MAG: hypothetical protein ABTQ32_27480 [Myxococcaceae bacterium]